MNIQTLVFPFSLHPGEIRLFRGAINELVGRDAREFHNHTNDPEAPTDYIWEYPVIQYGVNKGRACIRGVGPGADQLVRRLLPKLLDTEQISIGGITHPVTGFRLNNGQWMPRLFDQAMPFGLHRWVALSKENYSAWQGLEGNDRARQMILARALTGHLRRQAALLAPDMEEEQIVAEIIKEDARCKINWHKATLIGFNVVAKSRYVPPPGPGLGRLTAFGFGEVVDAERYDRLLRTSSTVADRARQ